MEAELGCFLTGSVHVGQECGVGATLGVTRRESSGLDEGVRRSASGGGEVAR